MLAYYAGTMVKTGTPTTSKNNFYKAIQMNRRRQTTRGNRQNHFQWDWKDVAKYNDNYEKFIRKEMLRIGEESDEFQMSYNCKWLLERGMFVTSNIMDDLGDTSQELVKVWHKTPVVVGIDPARKTDSTVVTVVWVDWDRPDEFGYLETVIFHEFMHFYHDDTEYYNIKQGCNHRIMNWASDFRSNYLLTKSGFTQLPLGLYSDEINFDRQNSLDEMYEVVKKELENQHMQVGSIVIHPDDSLGQIISINGDSIETNPITKEEADAIIAERQMKEHMDHIRELLNDKLLAHAYSNKKPFNMSSDTPNKLPPELARMMAMMNNGDENDN